MVINEYFIDGYWWIFCYWILVDILLLDISGYFVIGYWWLLYQWLLVTILLMVIGEYSIVDIGGY